MTLVPISISQIDKPFLFPRSSLPIGLSLNPGEAVRARVLDVLGARAVLDIDGQIVSAETKVPLSVGSQIQLIVKGSQGEQLIMQLARPPVEARPLSNADLRLYLQNLGLNEDSLNLPIAKSLIKFGMELSEQNISAIRIGLLKSQAGSEMIEQAVFLRQSNIPITGTSLLLAAAAAEKGVLKPTSWTRLIDLIEAAIGVQETYRDRANLAGLLRQLREVLGAADPRRDAGARYTFTSRLLEAVDTANTPMENHLFRLLSGDRTTVEDGITMLLGRIKDEAAASMKNRVGGGPVADLVETIESMSRSIEFQQLANAAQLASPSDRKLFMFNLPVMLDNRPQNCFLRVEKEARGQCDSGEQAPVRLTLDLSFSNIGPVTIDLRSMSGRRLECQLGMTEPGAARYAQAKSPQLLESLKSLGFQVQHLECTVKSPNAADVGLDNSAFKQAAPLKIDYKA